MSRSAPTAVVLIGLLLAGCARVPNPFRTGERPSRTPSAGEVAIPYGTQDEEDVTGAVTPVDTSGAQHFQSVLDMLRGHVPGLQVTELPSGEIRLRIRGGNQSLRGDDEANEPLIVIDDMPVRPGATRLALKGLIPQQVASIQVLKDVSTTSVYGPRGANGVILIYMKR